MFQQIKTQGQEGKIEKQNRVLYENSYVTNVIYFKIRILYTAIMCVTFSTILCSFSIFDLSHYFNNATLNDQTISYRERNKNYMLCYSTLASITLIVLEIMLKYYLLQYKINKGQDIFMNRFFSLDNIKDISLNIFFYILHPNLFVEHVSLFNEKNEIAFSFVNDDAVVYTLNDILLALNLLNIIPFFGAALKYINFNSNVADRICKLNGFKRNALFGVKCLFKKHPIQILFFFFFTNMCIFAIGLRICEYGASMQIKKK